MSIISGIYITYKFLYVISKTIEITKEGNDIDTTITGMIGDFMGGVVGTIWSFAGVILFFLALRLQSKELSLQIEELKSTREVFTIQQFENTFFNLLKTQNDIRLSVEYRIENRNAYGILEAPTVLNAHAAFEEIKKFMLNERKKLEKNLLLMQRDDLSEDKKQKNIKGFLNYYSVTYEIMNTDKILESKSIYKITFNEFHNQLGHYFRNLYHILLYLKESEDKEISLLEHEEFLGKRIAMHINGIDVDLQNIKKKYRKYANFVQAQMSGTELLLLFYNCLFFSKMKALVQYYEIISNLSLDDLLNPEVDNNCYPEINSDRKTIPEIKLKNRSQRLQM